MSCLQSNSEHALTHAVMAELDRERESPLHAIIRLSCAMSFLRNGIRSCSVQVECKAGCGYLVEAFGEEAEILRQKANAIQSMLKERGLEGSSKSIVDVLQ